MGLARSAQLVRSLPRLSFPLFKGEGQTGRRQEPVMIMMGQTSGDHRWVGSDDDDHGTFLSY